jgi:hypothetical protein
MDIHIPAPPPKRIKDVALTQIAARWGKRVAYAKYLLEKAGVPIVPVARPPVDGVRMRDLLAFEESIRQQQKGEAASK